MARSGSSKSETPLVVPIAKGVWSLIEVGVGVWRGWKDVESAKEEFSISPFGGLEVAGSPEVVVSGGEIMVWWCVGNL